MSSTFPVLLCEREAAQYLQISLSTLRRWRSAGDGPVHLHVGRIIRYRKADLDDYVAAKIDSTRQSVEVANG